MIWLDDEGHIVMRSTYKHQGVENIIGYQKTIIHLLQTQNQDCVNEDTTYNALAILEDMLFVENQVNILDVQKAKRKAEFEKLTK